MAQWLKITIFKHRRNANKSFKIRAEKNKENIEERLKIRNIVNYNSKIQIYLTSPVNKVSELNMKYKIYSQNKKGFNNDNNQGNKGLIHLH